MLSRDLSDVEMVLPMMANIEMLLRWLSVWQFHTTECNSCLNECDETEILTRGGSSNTEIGSWGFRVVE